MGGARRLGGSAGVMARRAGTMRHHTASSRPQGRLSCVSASHLWPARLPSSYTSAAAQGWGRQRGAHCSPPLLVDENFNCRRDCCGLSHVTGGWHDRPDGTCRACRAHSFRRRVIFSARSGACWRHVCLTPTSIDRYRYAVFPSRPSSFPPPQPQLPPSQWLHIPGRCSSSWRPVWQASAAFSTETEDARWWRLRQPRNCHDPGAARRWRRRTLRARCVMKDPRS